MLAYGWASSPIEAKTSWIASTGLVGLNNHVRKIQIKVNIYEYTCNS